MRRILGARGTLKTHWVGNGFPARTLFSYSKLAEQLSPFLMLDLVGPEYFSPSDEKRGVGGHPHRGFEAVTLVYQGEIAHRDSEGGGGVIRPGDVQWMTAASGIFHEEFHSAAFSRAGGTLQMVQLWVNLPARYKMVAPRYQCISSRDIPTLELAGGTGSLRVIAGRYAGYVGPACTFTPVDVWDLRLLPGRPLQLKVPDERNAIWVVVRGCVQFNGQETVREAQAVLLSHESGLITLTADAEALVLFLSGEPIDEPVVGHGPFVMNTEEEINQAVDDFNAGSFGRIPPAQPEAA